MDIAAIFKLLRRRWRVVVPTAVIVGAVLTVTLIVQPPTYRATSTAVLLSPPQPPETGAALTSNPLARFNDISVVADILSRILSSDKTAQSLRAEGLTGTYVAAANTDFLRGPIIQVTSEARSKAAAETSVTLVVDRLEKQLASLQKAQGTAPRYFFTSEVIVPVTDATVVFSSVLRRAFVALVLAIAVVIGVALLADALDRGVLQKRRQRSAAAHSSLEAPSRTE